MEQHFTHIANRARSASTESVGSPWPAGLTPQPVQGEGLHTDPSYTEGKAPIPSAPRINIAVGLADCHMMHTLKQKKEVHIKSRTGKNIKKKKKTYAQHRL